MSPCGRPILLPGRRRGGSRSRWRRRRPRSPAGRGRARPAGWPRGRTACPSGGRRGSPCVRGVIAAATARGVDVVAARLDVDEDRHAAALADGVRRGDEGVADRDHLVARPDAERRGARGGAPSCSSTTAQAWAAPTWAANSALEGGDLRALGQPAGQDGGGGGLGLLGAEQRLGDRDHDARSPGLRRRLAAPPVDEVADALLAGRSSGGSRGRRPRPRRRRAGGAPG